MGGVVVAVVKVFATKPNNLNSIPRTHMIAGENLFLNIVPRAPHECMHTYIY